MQEDPLKILLVEDDPSHCAAIFRAFEAPDSWVNIEVARSLEEYARMTEQICPDIVLMDLNLPDGQAVEMLHGASGDRAYPVLILTSHGNEKMAVTAMKAGALDYIVKSPASFAELPRSVGRALREWNLLQRHKQVQAEVLRSSQLASLGELAAGVAHEINNPINGVINYAQLLANRLSIDECNRDIAERIIHEGNRVATIVKSLLSFARSEEDGLRSVDLGDILRECLSLVEAQLGKEGIRLKVHIPKDLPAVSARSQQLQQVFLNLISNARYALNEKFPEGKSDKVLEINAERHGITNNFVRVIFHDHGTGIAENVRDKVVNPFFTTKPPDRGTGLGLSISYGIIKDHGGCLHIDSEVGRFTKMTIDLPLQKKQDI